MEKYNGTIWKAVTMALKTCGLLMACWQDVLPDALHSLHSLLCKATNCGPYERLLNFERRSSVGGSVPSWLIMPGPVVLKHHAVLARMISWWTKLSFCRATCNTLTFVTWMAERRLCQYATWCLFPRLLTFKMMFFQQLMYRNTAVVHMVMNCYMGILETFKLLKPCGFQCWG